MIRPMVLVLMRIVKRKDLSEQSGDVILRIYLKIIPFPLFRLSGAVDSLCLTEPSLHRRIQIPGSKRSRYERRSQFRQVKVLR